MTKNLMAGTLLLMLSPALAHAGLFQWGLEYYDGKKDHEIKLPEKKSVHRIPSGWVCEASSTMSDELKKLGRMFQVEYKTLRCVGPHGDRVEIDAFCEFNAEIHKSDTDRASVVLFSKGKGVDVGVYLQCKN